MQASKLKKKDSSHMQACCICGITILSAQTYSQHKTKSHTEFHASTAVLKPTAAISTSGGFATPPSAQQCSAKRTMQQRQGHTYNSLHYRDYSVLLLLLLAA